MRAEAELSGETHIRDAIAHATEIARARHETASTQRLHELQGRLRSETFNLAVLGEFKRGKSTLVNALVGREVLPTGVLPLTSVVTRVRWGSTPGARITFGKGESRAIPLERLVDFVAESANPANRLDVAEADVYLPSDLLRTGVVVLDTPGVGSTLAHNTDATLRFLPDVDAAVFVTATDPPISESERAFLHSIRTHAHKMFFVVNKADSLPPEELDAVVRFTRGVIAEALGQEVQVRAVSARASLRGGDEGLDGFKDALADFLTRDMARVGAASVAAKSRDVVRQLQVGVALELDAFGLTERELASRRERLESIRREVDRSRAGLSVLVRNDVAAVVASAERDLATWRDDETADLLAAARDALAGPDPVAPAELDTFVKNRLRADIESWRPSVEAKVEASWRDLSARWIAEIDQVAARAVDACSHVLSMTLPPPPAMDGSIDRSRFTYSFFEVPTLGESLLPDFAAVLPVRSGGRLALRRVDARIPFLVDRHSGRMRHDLVTRLTHSGDLLVREMDRHLDALTQGLATALDRAIENLHDATRSQGDAAPELIRLADELAGIADRLSLGAASPGERA